MPKAKLSHMVNYTNYECLGKLMLLKRVNGAVDEKQFINDILGCSLINFEIETVKLGI